MVVVNALADRLITARIDPKHGYIEVRDPEILIDLYSF